MEMKRKIALMLALLLTLTTPAIASSSQAKKVISVAMKQIGAPYKLESDSPNSFNCFTFWREPIWQRIIVRADLHVLQWMNISASSETVCRCFRMIL